MATAAAPRAGAELGAREFAAFQRFIYDAAGITLGDAKQALVAGRLSRRLAACGVANFADYARLLASGSDPAEVQRAVDLLTTNETYFFREARHFERLRAQALAAQGRGRAFRVWSAAGSSGEEAWSAAMVLDEVLGGAAWEVLASDISLRVLAAAERAVYPMERARHVPPAYLKRYCRRGTAEHAGTLLVDRGLRQRVRFAQVNLNRPLPEIGSFDVVFLRNVMIYFNDATKRQVVERVVARLASGGLLCVGLSESLHGLGGGVVAVEPSVYRRA